MMRVKRLELGGVYVEAGPVRILATPPRATWNMRVVERQLTIGCPLGILSVWWVER